ncbi:MAG: protein of unknown function with transrane region [Candidatus Adlerbacteria bacterium]|nr:protein of unknown function with transrane region [Candidatus Adlerbacteria bacterium]
MKKSTFIAASFAAPLAAVLIAGTAFAAPLTRSLDMGATGSDVTSLQTFLAADVSLYPEGLVTGYFGSLTRAAIQRFQAKNGIVSSGTAASTGYGRVGPSTMAAINAQMSGGSTSNTTEGAGKVTNTDVFQPVVTNVNVVPSTNSATVTWNSNVPATAKVFYSTSWPFNYNTSATAVSNNGYNTAQNVTLNNLTGSTTYYYTVESLDASGNFTWSQSGSSFKTN